jgi:hypothetical protein
MFEIEVKNNAGQFHNDLEWLKVSNPEIFKTRQNEACKEMAVLTRRHNQKTLQQKMIER